MVERRWCVSCQVLRPSIDFKLVKAGKTSRWKCKHCLERNAVPKYKGNSSNLSAITNAYNNMKAQFNETSTGTA